jgi:membrane-bound serine protease (ClpP class)
MIAFFPAIIENMNLKLIARARHWPGRYLRFLCALFLLGSTPLAQASGTVILLDLEGAIGVATAEYIINGIDEAENRGAELVIIRMDTPGGLVNPMRDIVKAILNANVPVATYVAPDGARADSAGTYILLASHIAAMAPTTHLGAATPVALGDGGGKKDKHDSADEKELESNDERGETHPDSAMEKKIMNDSIAYIRGLAKSHNRNADWAEKAVTEAATLIAAEALENNVIDLIAVNLSELLQKINGRELEINHRTIVLKTESIDIETIEPSWRIKMLSTIASPEIALLLLTIGIYGLLFEGYNPGAIVPAVVGVICLLLAAYALQVLPVNYAGFALIIVGIALIIAEAMIPSFGVLGIGGIVAFIFGSIMMFDSGVPGFSISVVFVIALAILAGLFLFWLVSYLVRLRRRGATSGRASILGGIGTAMESFTGNGKIWLEGESWRAVSKVAVEEGQAVVVRAINGLTLEVEPAHEPHPTDAEF